MSAKQIISTVLTIAMVASQFNTAELVQNYTPETNPPPAVHSEIGSDALPTEENSEVIPPALLDDSVVQPPAESESTPPSSESVPPISESIPPSDDISSTPPDESAAQPPAESESTPPISESVPPAVDSSIDTEESGSSSTSDSGSEILSENKPESMPVIEKSEEELKAEAEKARLLLPNVATYAARGGTTLDGVGGGVIEYYGGSPHIEVYANSSTRNYGDAFVPGGVVFKVYGLNEGDVSLADFAGGTYEILATNGIAQDLRTPVGAYNVYCSASLSNLNIKGNNVPVNSGAGYVNAAITVNKRPVTLAATSKQKAYGADDPAFEYTVVSGSIVPGDVFLGGLFRIRSGPATERVDTYEIKSTISNSNYVITYVPGTLEITRGTIVVTGTTDAGREITREYGSIIPPASYTVSGLKFNDTVNDPGNPNNLGNITVTCSVTNTSAPGNYPITVSGLGDVLDNYNINYTNGNVIIKKRSINAVANAYTKEYGTVDTPLSAVVTAPNAGNPAAPDTGDDGNALFPLTYSLARAVGENKGVYPISITVTPASQQYYDVRYTPANVTIQAAVLTITAKDATREYGNENPAFSVTYSGFKNGEDKSILGGALEFTTIAGKLSNVNKYPIMPSGLTSSNYDIKFVNGILKIEPRIVFATMHPKTKVYGQPDAAMTYTLEEEPIDPVGSPLIGVPFRKPGEAVGLYQISASFSNKNYTVIVDTANYTITAATLHAKVVDTSRIYGDENPAFAIEYTGFAFGDTENVVSGTPVFDTEANKKSFVGKYDVTVSGLSSKNYTITFDKGSLAVTPRALTVTLEDKTQIYGAVDTELTYSLSNPLIDPEGSPLMANMHRAAGKDVGTYPITGTFTNSNYTISVIDGEYIITSAGLLVTVNDTSRVYGGEEPQFTVSYDGLQYSEDASAITGSLVFTTDAEKKSFVGDYSVSASGLSSKNYDITYATGTLSITQRPLIISARNFTKEYGEKDEALTYTLSDNLVDEIGSPLVGALVREQGENTGSYAITGDFVNSNYAISFVAGTYSITPAPLTVKANDFERIYGDANPDFTVTGTGFKANDDLSSLLGKAKFTTDADKLSGIGDYPVSVDGLTSKNYTITFEQGSLSITPRDLTVTLEDKTQIYGAVDTELTYSLSNPLIDPEGSPLTANMHRAAGKDVGIYPITGTFTNSNYTISVIDGEYIITSAGLLVTVNDTSRVYGGEDPQFTVSYDGLQYSEDASAITGSLIFTTDAEKKSFVGDYSVSASGLSSKNYDITYATGTLSITQRPLIISARNFTKEYGEKDEALTYTLSDNLVDEVGSPLVGALVREQGENTGSYAITGDFINSNYAISFVVGTYSITPAPLTVKVNDFERIYGDANPDFTVTGTGFKANDDLSSLLGKAEFTTDADKLSGIGDYPVSVDGLTSKNYTITFEQGKLTITPRPIIVGIDSKTQVYGDKEQELTYTLNEPVIDPANPIAVTLKKPDGKDANMYIITGTAKNDNYIISIIPGIYVITPAPLTVTVTDKERPHGGENPKFEVVYDGFKNDEKEDILTGELIFTTDASSTSSGGEYAVSASGISGKNYTITFVNGKLTVQPAPIPEAQAPQPIPSNPATGNSFLETYFILPIAAAALALTLLAQSVFAYFKKRKRAKQQKIFTNKFNPQNKK